VNCHASRSRTSAYLGEGAGHWSAQLILRSHSWRLGGVLDKVYVGRDPNCCGPKLGCGGGELGNNEIFIVCDTSCKHESIFTIPFNIISIS